MKKIILMQIFVIAMNTLCESNPMPAPQLYLINVSIPTDSTWSIIINSGRITNSTYFDSVVVMTSKDTAVYSIAKLSLQQKQVMDLNEFTLINDSLSKSIKINPEDDKITITMYCKNITYTKLENTDFVSFGTYPNAMFIGLTPIASIRRSEIGGAFYDLYYDSGIPCSFTLKGIVYDEYSVPLKNTLLAEGAVWNYTGSGTEFIYTGTFQTDSIGEFQMTQSCTNQNYQLMDICIQGNPDPGPMKIKGINIRAVNDTVINCDIHMLDYSVFLPNPTLSKFSLFPNPAGTLAILSYSLSTASNAVIEVINLQGVPVESIRLIDEIGSLKLYLDNKYTTGMYIVRVVSNKKVLYSQKLIVNK